MAKERIPRRDFLASVLSVGLSGTVLRRSALEGKALEEAESKETEAPTQEYQWRPHLHSYLEEELRRLKFQSREDLGLAIDLLWNDKRLRGVPWDSPNHKDIVLPKEAIEYLDAEGVKFRVYKKLGRKY